MALSEELFPPKIIEGQEVPHPATLTSQPQPLMREAQLSDEMFPRENAAGAHFMIDIDSSQPHHRGPRDIPLPELYAEALAARAHTAANRARLSKNFTSAGFSQLAIGISERGATRLAEQQDTIGKLRSSLREGMAAKIGATVVIPE